MPCCKTDLYSQRTAFPILLFHLLRDNLRAPVYEGVLKRVWQKAALFQYTRQCVCLSFPYYDFFNCRNTVSTSSGFCVPISIFLPFFNSSCIPMFPETL